MSIGISLSPPSTDISVGLLSSLLGPKWWLLATGQAPSGAGSILGTMFSVFDIALLMYVSALLVYQATVGGMATAHEGTPLGRRYHSIWAPIRGPAAFAMLFPLPWAKGLALIQCIALLAVYWGIGVADDVWNAFVQEIPKMSGVIMPSRQSIDRDNQFVTKALMMATVQEYLIQRANMPLGGRWVWRGGVNSGDWIFTQYLTKGSSAKSGSK
jgi:conjugal transfer/type IV secretion protein DotA/TraY